MKEFDEYIESLEIGGKSPATIRSYKKDVSKVLNFFKIQTIDELKAITVEQYISFYKSIQYSESNPNGLKPRSMNGLVRSFSAFLNNIGESENAFFRVKLGGGRFVKVPKRSKIVLTYEESKALINAANNVQDKFMLALMLTTAIRRDEVGKIKLSDISGCHIRIIGKGDKERVTKMDETICTMFNIYMAQRGFDSDYLFYATRGQRSGQLSGTSVNSRVKACAEKAAELGTISRDRAEKITAHRLRGTLISDVAREFGIYAAQKLAGHASISTTMLYLENGDMVTEDVIDKRSGRFSDVI